MIFDDGEHSLGVGVKILVEGIERYEKFPNKPSFPDRVLALLFDCILVLIPIIIIQAIVYLYNGSLLSASIYVLLLSFYKIFFHWRKGTTFGKIQVGIIIIGKNGKDIKLYQAIARETLLLLYAIIIVFAETDILVSFLTEEIIINSISVLAILSLIDVLWIFRSNKNTLHDVASQTFCYKK